MTTIREQILAEIATVLAGTTGVGTRIYRSRPEAVTRGETPVILIEPVMDKALQQVIRFTEHSLTVRLSVVVRSATPDQAADSVIESMHSKLMEDITLGGLAMAIDEGATQFLIEDADKPSAVIACDYDIRYRTRVENLSASN